VSKGGLEPRGIRVRILNARDGNCQHTSCGRGKRQVLSTIVPLLQSMVLADPPTTITIRTSTRRLLESMKRPGESYDDLLQELAEEYYPPKLIAELKKRVSEIRAGKVKGVPAEAVYRRWGV
jgi:predicted CopG family antitoxin